MTTVINNPGVQEGGESTSNSMATIATLLIIGLLAILFWVYGLPALRGNNTANRSEPADVRVNINQEQPQTEIGLPDTSSPEPTANEMRETPEPETSETESPIRETVAPSP